MSAVVVLTQALPSASSGMDCLYQFTNNLTNLTTQNGGALTQLGLTTRSHLRKQCWQITSAMRSIRRTVLNDSRERK